MPVGVNHSQEGMGRRRHKTPAASSWGEQVWEAVYNAASAGGLLGPEAWGVANSERPLTATLRFFVAPCGGGRRVQDADAPIKATLDDVARALRLDDACIRAGSWSQTIIDDDARERRHGYGPTRQGCWIEVRRLTVRELAALDAIAPGEPR